MSGPAEYAYDVIVIGAGPVGYTLAARVRAAELSVVDEDHGPRLPGKDEHRWV